MENNIKVARAHRAISWFYAVLGIALTAAILIPAEHPLDALAGLAVMLAIFGGLFSLHHFTAKGAREKKQWARAVSSIIGVIMLPGFPVGTMIGIYLLVNANRGWEPASDPANAG